MLCELRVKNLALIEFLELGFDQGKAGGLVVMTGETGAGKSIMLRAIHLLSGGRASSDWIRSGAESCEVEALFEINPHHHLLLQKLEEGGFGEEPSLVIKRIMSDSGRSRFYVNGSLATGKIVAELTAELLSVASQHDHQQLLQPGLHLDYLDTLGDLWADRLLVGKIHKTWQDKRAELTALRLQEQEKEQRQDFLRFQVSEIREAALQPGEDELLLAEKKRLKNAQTLITLSQSTHRLLSHELMDHLTTLRLNMAQLAAIDPGVVKLAEDITGYTFLAEDYVNELKGYRDSLENDPYRQEQVAERLDLIQQLKRKYGVSVEDILDFAEQGERELEHLDNMDKEIAALEKEVALLESEMCDRARLLSEKRMMTAATLEAAMNAELSSLAFHQAGFQMVWKDVVQLPETMRATGWERGEFFFSANPGEPAKPLAKIASGGELSRLMLAMKCLLARKDMVETVIFDEVDAGIGGEAAEAVARKIQELSAHHQVFCITHLPQIAARGTLHFQVSKKVGDGRTQSAVVRLTPESRVQELVRMLAGDSATEQTQAWAEELLVKGGACA
ncbi:DNA repair protein RecN [Desulfocastanea catecholica]